MIGTTSLPGAWSALPVVCSADDAFRVEPYAAHQLIVSLEHAQTVAELNVPESAGQGAAGGPVIV